MLTISTEKEHKAKGRIVFSKEVSYRNGQKARLKDFSRRYKEIELSLPNELTLEQNREIVDRFIANHLSNHYYAYAIHEKNGELSGERTPHVHIMFSERLIDDVEQINERPAYKYFRRAARPLKGEQVASFERRRQHSAPKSKKPRQKSTTLSYIPFNLFSCSV